MAHARSRALSAACSMMVVGLHAAATSEFLPWDWGAEDDGNEAGRALPSKQECINVHHRRVVH